MTFTHYFYQAFNNNPRPDCPENPLYNTSIQPALEPFKLVGKGLKEYGRAFVNDPESTLLLTFLALGITIGGACVCNQILKETHENTERLRPAIESIATDAYEEVEGWLS